jgi:ZIP family zinc transporter
LIIGIGTTFSTGLGFLLALGQLPADIPEGFASIATFKDAGLPRSKRLLLSASFALPVVLGATIGFWIVRGQSELFKLVLLAFTAAILLVAAVEDIMTEAHSKADDARLQQLALTGGFALFMLLALYLG